MVPKVSDYVIKDMKAKFYPCKSVTLRKHMNQLNKLIINLKKNYNFLTLSLIQLYKGQTPFSIYTYNLEYCEKCKLHETHIKITS